MFSKRLVAIATILSKHPLAIGSNCYTYIWMIISHLQRGVVANVAIATISSFIFVAIATIYGNHSRMSGILETAACLFLSSTFA